MKKLALFIAALMITGVALATTPPQQPIAFGGHFLFYLRTTDLARVSTVESRLGAALFNEHLRPWDVLVKTTPTGDTVVWVGDTVLVTVLDSDAAAYGWTKADVAEHWAAQIALVVYDVRWEPWNVLQLFTGPQVRGVRFSNRVPQYREFGTDAQHQKFLAAERRAQRVYKFTPRENYRMTLLAAKARIDIAKYRRNRSLSGKQVDHLVNDRLFRLMDDCANTMRSGVSKSRMKSVISNFRAHRKDTELR